MARKSDNDLKISRGTQPKPAKVPAADKAQTLKRKIASDRLAAGVREREKLRILPVEADDRPIPEWSPPETVKRSASPRPHQAGRPQAVAGSLGSTEAPAPSTPPAEPKPSVPSAASSAAPAPAQPQPETVAKQVHMLEHLLIPHCMLEATGCLGPIHVSSAKEFMKKFRAAADDSADPVEGLQLELVTFTVHRVARLHAAAEQATTAELKQDLNRAAKELTGEIPKLIDTLTKYRLSRPASQQSPKQAGKPGNKQAGGAGPSAPPAPGAQKESQPTPPSPEDVTDRNGSRQGGNTQ